MKATYQKPETMIFLVTIQHHLMEASRTGKGVEYKEGDAVLSRRNSSFSVWGEDEEEE